MFRTLLPVTRCFAVVATAAALTAQVDTWTLLSPTNSPSARRSAAAAFDAARQRVVLFGGWSTTASTLGDAWQWDGTNWTASFSLHYPPGRWNSAMAYDSARQRTVMFGGYIAGVVSAQTWEWDGTAWQQRLPATVPPPRAKHALAYDPVHQRTVMYGGTDGNNSRSDTWVWDGTNWQQRTTTGVLLSGRVEHAMAYDAARQRVVLFGGESGGGGTADTVEWDGLAWTQMLPAASPSPRYGHAMAYDLTRQRLVVFSGAYASPTADTWTRGTAGTPAVATTYGLGCAGQPAGFVPSPTARPIVGQNGGAVITNAPTQLGAVAMGWSNTAYGPFTLPVTLGGIGMPGCELLQSADVLGLPTSVATPTQLSFSLAIPPGPTLIGVHVYLQGYVFAPGANALQVVTTNGIDWMFGDV